MRVITTTFLAAATMLAASCGGVPLRAGADFHPDHDFTQYVGYIWDEPDQRPTGDPRLDENPFFIHRLHAAIHWELPTRGIRYRAPGPALTVHHHATVRDRVGVYEADREAGYGSEYGEGTQVIQYEEGTFLVDIADARTREVVWRGWARLDLGRALEDPDVMSEQIDVAIARMFVGFPISPGTRQEEIGEGR